MTLPRPPAAATDYLDRARALALLAEGPARAAAVAVIGAFLDGALCAREHEGLELAARLDRLPVVAYEGAGWMARDLAPLLASRPRMAALLCIGHGWGRALQRLPPGPGPSSAPAWAARWSVDGHGFFEGLMRPRQALAEAALAGLDDEGRELFDQGVGRSLWYSHGGNVHTIAYAIRRAKARGESLWRGVGVAAAFSGGILLLDDEGLRELANRGGPGLREGVVIGAAAALELREGVREAALVRAWLGVDVSRVQAKIGAATPTHASWRRSLTGE